MGSYHFVVSMARETLWNFDVVKNPVDDEQEAVGNNPSVVVVCRPIVEHDHPPGSICGVENREDLLANHVVKETGTMLVVVVVLCVMHRWWICFKQFDSKEGLCRNIDFLVLPDDGIGILHYPRM